MQPRIGRLLHMGLPELAVRGRQETYKLLERIRPIHIAGDPPPRGKSSTLLASRYFFTGACDERVPEVVSAANPDECQALLAHADRLFRGSFDLLGYRGLEFGKPVDWHLDPVSGRRAPLVHWSRLDVLDAPSVGDTKVIWELNRHQWLVHLAQAFRLTRYDRYAEAVIRHLRDWLRANPIGMGINWASSLEAALRIISWSWSILLIRDSNALTDEAVAIFEEAVNAHAMHVERYLSYYFSPNTHLTGEALGLFYAGVLFFDSKRGERWRSTAVRILEQEIERQVHPDGVYFEQSTCYQRYTIDIYLQYLMLASRAGMEVNPRVRDVVKSMLEVLIAVRQPDGSVPGIGDEDGGMVLPLGTSEPYDYRATFSTAAVVLNDPVCAWAAGSIAPETLWLLGADAATTFDAMQKSRPQSETSRVFPDGGIVVMRSGWDTKAHALIFDAGPLGCRHSSGHGHADLLSIQLSAFGERYLVDAGTCCYTANPDLRNFFRTTAAHSTVMIDGKSQAEPSGPFSWRSRCAARLLDWKSDESVVYADAEHDAYSSLPDPVSHRRRVIFVRSRYWIVIDELDGKQSHRVDLRFQFDPMDVRIGSDRLVRASRTGREGLLLRTFSSTPLDVSVSEGRVSRHYGRVEPAPAIVYTANAKLPIRIVTLLWPAENVEAI